MPVRNRPAWDTRAVGIVSHAAFTDFEVEVPDNALPEYSTAE